MVDLECDLVEIRVMLQDKEIIRAKYQNRGTMGVQIPSSFLKILDFKPLQTKVRVLPWQTNKTFIIVFIYSFLPGNALFCEDFR